MRRAPLQAVLILAGLVLGTTIAANPAEAFWRGRHGAYGRRIDYGPRLGFGYGHRFGYASRLGFGYASRFGYFPRVAFGYGPVFAPPDYLPPLIVYAPPPILYVPRPVVIAPPRVARVVHHATVVHQAVCTCVCHPSPVAPPIPPVLRGPVGSGYRPPLPALRPPTLAQAEARPGPAGS